MSSEKVTLYKTNNNKTGVVEQLPKTTTTNVYDFENGQFLHKTIRELKASLGNSPGGNGIIPEDSVTLDKLSPQVRGLITENTLNDGSVTLNKLSNEVIEMLNDVDDRLDEFIENLSPLNNNSNILRSTPVSSIVNFGNNIIEYVLPSSYLEIGMSVPNDISKTYLAVVNISNIGNIPLTINRLRLGYRDGTNGATQLTGNYLTTGVSIPVGTTVSHVIKFSTSEDDTTNKSNYSHVGLMYAHGGVGGKVRLEQRIYDITNLTNAQLNKIPWTELNSNNILNANYSQLSKEAISVRSEGSKWEGRTWLTIGDNITSNGGYQNVVKQRLNFGKVINRAIASAPVGRFMENVTTQDVQEADLITIYGCFNNFTVGSPIIGNITDIPNTVSGTSFIGRFKHMIEQLLTIRSDVRIVIIGTHNGTDSQRPPINGYVTGTSTILDYVNAMGEVAKYYSLPFINMYQLSGINSFNLNLFTTDGLHLNADGNNLIGNILTKELAKFEPVNLLTNNITHTSNSTMAPILPDNIITLNKLDPNIRNKIKSTHEVYLKDIITNPSQAGTQLSNYFTNINTVGNVTLVGDTSIIYTINTEVDIFDKVDVTFRDVKFTGNSSFRSFKIDNNSKRIRFINCSFNNMQRVLSIYTASDILVESCVFDWCGYCILGMFHFSHHNIRVINNECFNARGDFVEMNSDTSRSSNVIVMGNIFHGSVEQVIHETHLYREQRFVGATGIKNIIISNNIIKGTFASAVHVEVIEGQCIVSNNTFEHCVIRRKTNAGNRLGGVVEISGNCKDMIITGNYFIKNEEWVDPDGSGKKDDSCFIWFNYYESTRPVIISNNIFDERGLPSWTFGTTKQSALRQNKGGIVFTGNKIINGNKFDISDVKRMTISNNTFDCPIISDLGCPTNVNFSNNTISVKNDVQYSIKLRESSPTGAGTVNAKNIIINGNFINKPMEMRFPKNIILSNNMMPNDVALTSGTDRVDGMLLLFGTNMTIETCNVKATGNLLAQDVLDGEWNWLNPIPDVPTGYDDFDGDIPLYG